jgi:hypothetical protein
VGQGEGDRQQGRAIKYKMLKSAYLFLG